MVENSFTEVSGMNILEGKSLLSWSKFMNPHKV